ncbi:hypothetical protein PtA15_12A224 [Puccinia triticina]|uniref:PAC1-like LisH-like dimerisation domain-containing protein n=1 Tax=Puccinia triticina TaxID=208348 RepID=A0ABY7D5P2_9BASI|nr:uncharacterized protein PtA15_12A224 [Puccinia triticina]WAQ90237.1 hypothetical protein PtA15_12A224 [Puccinia triticina]
MAPLTSVLSERQKDELALLDYLSSAGLHSTFEALKSELPAQQDFQPDPKAKWAVRLRSSSSVREQNGVVTGRRSQTGHRSPITALAFHPTFSSLASASEDCTIKIWDYETGEFEITLKGHTKVVCDVDYDSKGSFLVSCSSDLTIKLWDASNNYRCTKTLYDHDHSVSSSRFLPGDTHIVSASRDQTIKIWEVATSFCVKTLRGHSEWVRGVWPWTHGKLLAPTAQDARNRAPDPAFVATGSRDKTIRIWDCNSGQCLKTLVGHDNWIRALEFHPNGRLLLSCSDDKTIRAWDLRAARCLKVLDAHDHFESQPPRLR